MVKKSFLANKYLVFAMIFPSGTHITTYFPYFYKDNMFVSIATRRQDTGRPPPMVSHCIGLSQDKRVLGHTTADT